MPQPRSILFSLPLHAVTQAAQSHSLPSSVLASSGAKAVPVLFALLHLSWDSSVADTVP